MAQQGWHRADIRAEIEKRGKTLTQLALDHGLHPAACRHALNRRHLRAEKVISAFIGVPLWVLWPDRWTEGLDGSAVRTDGRRKLRKRYRVHDTARPAAGHCQKAEAA